MAHQFEFSAMHKGGLPGELYTAAGDGLAGEMAESQVGSLHAPLSDNVSILSHFSRAFRPAFRPRAGGKRDRESGAADFARLLFAGLAGPEEAPNVLPDARENHDKTLHFLRTLLRILL